MEWQEQNLRYAFIDAMEGLRSPSDLIMKFPKSAGTQSNKADH
jgi:hypothetical protein